MNNITTLKPKEGVELLAIVVDKQTDDFGYDINTGVLYSYLPQYNTINLTKKENYLILGTVEYNKPIEFDCDEIILKGKRKEELDFGLYDEYETYFDYTKSVMTRFMTNERCFISLIEANNINLEQLDKENKKLVILIKQ